MKYVGHIHIVKLVRRGNAFKKYNFSFYTCELIQKWYTYRKIGLELRYRLRRD